jgi:hypothetical protein
LVGREAHSGQILGALRTIVRFRYSSQQSGLPQVLACPLTGSALQIGQSFGFFTPFFLSRFLRRNSVQQAFFPHVLASADFGSLQIGQCLEVIFTLTSELRQERLSLGRVRGKIQYFKKGQDGLMADS